jgi:hypothetical protein
VVLRLLRIPLLPVIGPVPLVLGWHDLQKIKARQMDRRGKGLTEAGFVMGLIGTAIPDTALAAYSLMVLLCASLIGAPPPHSYRIFPSFIDEPLK